MVAREKLNVAYLLGSLGLAFLAGTDGFVACRPHHVGNAGRRQRPPWRYPYGWAPLSVGRANHSIK